MPRREDLPLFNDVAGCKNCVSAKAYNNGRLPQNCMATMWVSARFADAILRNDVLIYSMRAQMWDDVYVCLFIFLKPMACIFGGIAQSAPPPASKDNREYKISSHTLAYTRIYRYSY